MYEFHGWAAIHETTKEVDAGNLDLIIKRVQNFVSGFHWSNGLFKIYPANGIYYLSVGGLLNRKTNETENLINVYYFLAKEAPGSYGLLYIRDDESVDGHNNEFKVIVLAKGSLQMKEDVLLSPCVPVIEDNDFA